MAYAPYKVEKFGGLDLRSAPDESACIDIQNVEFDREGRIRRRYGFLSIVLTDLSSPRLFGWAPNYLVAADADEVQIHVGTTVTNVVAPAQFETAQAFGTPSANYLYLAAPGQTIRRLAADGTLSAPANQPACTFVSRQATDNRLVAANIGTLPTGSTATASGSLVHFSDAGAAETWTSTSWVSLDPGDGESITGTASWRDLLFVFKQTKFYVFYGNSTDASGNPVFNYKAVRGGIGANSNRVVAARDGVYFLDQAEDALWKTTGGPPVKVSTAIEPLLKGPAPEYFTNGSVTSTNPMTVARDRIVIPVGFSAAAGLLIYDIEVDAWMYWTANTSTTPSHVASTANGVLCVAKSGNNSELFNLSDSSSTDDIGTVTSYYRSGFYTPADDAECVIRQTVLHGTGAPTFKMSADWGSLDTGAAVTLGTSPAIDEGFYRTAYKGRRFSFQVSGTSAWTLQRLTHHLRGYRQQGPKS